ncbi:nicotinamide mononucleotide transporter [Actinoplanes sp. NEAU-A12]|uniref:Nicotinamide mononucleotide transporter n=1 Tax=Actinoplanes sandaracinus TaxID=3045177 RepID=A0ABT6X129_9ACTN|nr:nicotinamide mononucleotide transporter [Actinoplanes sandaracinus]
MGSVPATYAMARGWAEFWPCWIAVDLVGVPELLHFGYYPFAVLLNDPNAGALPPQFAGYLAHHSA